MAICGKCGHNYFITEPAILIGASKKAVFVCCGQCNTAIGVIDSEETNEKVDKIKEAIKQIANKLGVIVFI